MTAWAPVYSRFDASEIVMWLIAVGAVAGAALWAGHDFQEARQSSRSQVSMPILLISVLLLPNHHPSQSAFNSPIIFHADFIVTPFLGGGPFGAAEIVSRH